MLKGFSRFRDIAKERAFQSVENQGAAEEQSQHLKNAVAAMELHKLLRARLGVIAFCSSPTIEIDDIRFTAYVARKGESDMGSSLERWELQATYLLRFQDKGFWRAAPGGTECLRVVPNMETLGLWIKNAEDFIQAQKASVDLKDKEGL